MTDLDSKLEIIDAICKHHPSYGVKRGWSWYTGGMVDNGDWHVRKMLDKPLEELQWFLDELKNRGRK